jgi:hypothetical protein
MGNGWFTEGFDTPDLQEAKALLEGLAEFPLRTASPHYKPRRLMQRLITGPSSLMVTKEQYPYA